MSQNEKRDFDALAPNYDQEHAVLRAQAVAEAILRQVELRPDMDVMDFGAGTGLITLALLPHVRHITAVDSSQGMLGVLTRKLADQGIENVRTVTHDLVEDAPLGASFDLIVSAMTMHHLNDVGAMLRVFRGMLRSGGTLAVADLDTEDGTFHPDNTGIMHFGFDRDQMGRLFEQAGFTRLTVSTAHSVPKETASGEVKEFSVFLITGRTG